MMAVSPQAHIQSDDLHIIQNIWKKMWSSFVAHRREVKTRRENVTTPWYQASLEFLAKRLWEKRHLLFTSDAKMTSQEKEEVIALLEADKTMSRLRSVLVGVWHLFRESTTRSRPGQRWHN